MSDHDGKTLGQRIDELLAPYLKDKADLQARLDRDLASRQKLDAQIQATRRDLQIVENSMAEALRAAVRKDPLLGAAFGVVEKQDQPREAPAPPARPLRSNPLLNPTA